MNFLAFENNRLFRCTPLKLYKVESREREKLISQLSCLKALKAARRERGTPAADDERIGIGTNQRLLYIKLEILVFETLQSLIILKFLIFNF